MKFETKYNLGDNVWFMYNNKALRGRILGIEITNSCSHFDTYELAIEDALAYSLKNLV